MGVHLNPFTSQLDIVDSPSGDFSDLTLDLGTAAAPSISFDGDTNTGIYSPGADQLALSTNGTGRLFINETGQVGIGMSGSAIEGALSTNDAVVVRKNTDGWIFKTERTDNSQQCGFQALGHSGSVGVAAFTNNSERLRITSAGLVGIGTSSPSTTLDVRGAENSQQLHLGSISARGLNISTALNSSSRTDCLTVFSSGDINGEFAFETPGTRYMTITSLGRVGIGTSSPEAALTINPGNVGTTSIGGRSINYGANLNSSSGRTGYLVRLANNFTLNNDNAGFMWVYPFDTGGDSAYKVFRSATGSTLVDKFWVSQAGGAYFASSVGIGTTSPGQALEITGNQQFSDGADRTIFLSENGRIFSIVNNNSRGASASELRLMGRGANDFITFRINESERARIDSSGRLLVGTSTAHTGYGYTPQFQISGSSPNLASSLIEGLGTAVYPTYSRTNAGNTAVANNDTIFQLRAYGFDGAARVRAAAIECAIDGTPGANDMPGRLVFSTTADGESSPTERVRINNAGRLSSFSSSNVSNYAASASAAGTTDFIYYGNSGATGIDSGTNVYRVFTNGNVQNTNNSYGAISDLKLKENIVDATSQWSDIKALQVRKYNFKEQTGQQTHTQIGLIAQEVELVSPGLVSESPDRDEDGNDLGTVTKSVNYSVLYMKAVKALQEAMERIETLEAKVAALESA